MDNIDKLYQHYDTLSAAKDISQVRNLFFFFLIKHGASKGLLSCTFLFIQHQKEFEEILAAVKGSEKEKKLVPQFIAQFAKSFPILEGQVTDAMFDLCEDEDVMVRSIKSIHHSLC